MSTPTRIYVVTDTEDGAQRLVRATNQSQALRLATKDRFAVDIASQDDLVALISNGVPVLEATSEDEQGGTDDQG